MGEIFLSALALMLIIEGLLPLVNPGAWRRMFERVLQLSDGQIRFFGLISLLVGALLLMVWR